MSDKLHWFVAAFSALAIIAGGVAFFYEAPVVEVVPETVKIGWMGALSGEDAVAGEGLKRGVEMARDDMKIEDLDIIFEDTQCSAESVKSRFEKLVNEDGVIAIIADVCHDQFFELSVLAETARIPVVTSFVTDRSMIESPWVFSTASPYDLMYRYLIQWAHKKTFETMDVLYQAGVPEYLAIDEIVSKEFVGLGGEVNVDEAFKSDFGEEEYDELFERIDEADSDMLFLIADNDVARDVLRRFDEADVDIRVFGLTEYMSLGFLEDLDGVGDGLIVVGETSGTAGFKEQHDVKFGVAPGPYAAQAYDSYMAIGRAVESGALDGEAVKAELIRNDFDGSSGRIDFNEIGVVGGNFDVFEARDGEFVLK